MDGGGLKHRREIAKGAKRPAGSTAVYRWLKDNDYPTGFQTLCHNCNFAKHAYGACPHQTGGDAK